MTQEMSKRKLAFYVFARSKATKQSRFIDIQDICEIAAVVHRSVDSLAMTAGCGLVPTSLARLSLALTAFIRQLPLDPLLEKEGKPIIPLYQEGWILSRLFGTKDGVCQEYLYNLLIALTAGNYR